jgi:hypothetical protein
MLQQIEGVPAGYEIVAFRKPKADELILGTDGRVFPCPVAPKITQRCPIVRKVELILTWPHGVFKDGWIAEDEEGTQAWYEEEPELGRDAWDNAGCSRWVWLNDESDGDITCFVNKPVFRSDVSWRNRVHRVGPTIEATLKGAQ